jgi:hypothetical protein
LLLVVEEGLEKSLVVVGSRLGIRQGSPTHTVVVADLVVEDENLVGMSATVVDMRVVAGQGRSARIGN